MITLTYFYDEYIDRPKLTEQKKPIWVYSSSPHKGGRNNNSLGPFLKNTNMKEKAIEKAVSKLLSFPL